MSNVVIFMRPQAQPPRRAQTTRRPPREVVTGRLLGDPIPDRLQHSETLRAKLVRPRATVPDEVSDPRIVQVLRPLEHGSRQINEIADTAAINRASINWRVTPIVRSGLITSQRKGPKVFYSLSEEGRDYLRLASQ